MRLYSPDRLMRAWEDFLQTERSLLCRLFGAIVIATFGLVLTEAAYLSTGHYFSALPVATSTLIVLYSGYGMGLAAGVVLALTSDYLYLPPIGSVLDSLAGYVHLFFIITLTILMCVMVAALRLAFSRMKQARQSAEQARAEMERVLSVVSHDLRNPISVARARAEALLRFNADAERVKTIARGIVVSMDRADAMIRDLLDAHRLQLGEAQQSSLDLSAFANQLITDLTLVHGDRFDLRIQAGVSGPWSRQDLRRVIENLVGNAVKYGASEKKITLTVTQDSHETRISVHNFGKPISPERLSHLFKRDQLSERIENSQKEGWGIGLMSVSHIVESYDGWITVESDKDRGTLFTIHLPIRGAVTSAFG